MTRKPWLRLLGVWLILASPAFASTAEVAVVDKAGRPLADAVVELTAVEPGAAPATTRVRNEAIVDQRHETFLPLVSVIRRGGHVVFTNNDTTMHQVYSFSPIKQFAFEIDEGQRSPPVVFDKAGVAAIGCNIHDRMITYVYVAQGSLAARTDRTGKAAFADVPPGYYRGTVWHPQLAPGAAPYAFALPVGAAEASTNISLPVNGLSVAAKKAMHMQMY